MRRWPGIVLIAIPIIAGFLLLGWIAGEKHYENCLAAVELRYGSEPQKAPDFGESLSGEYGDLPPSLDELRDETQWIGARNGAISDCSRWP